MLSASPTPAAGVEAPLPAAPRGLPVGRTLFGGFLMGLANLVPGISGGTMILVVGLYDRFIGAVADVTRLRLKRASLAFLALFGVGFVVAVLSLSGVAVALVTEQRWIMYALFIGMTLGAVPDLLVLMRPVRPSAALAFALGLGLMLLLAFGRGALGVALPETIPVFLLVGALAAASMVLPGISGSYLLLILGMYDLVIGSLSPAAWREDPGLSLRVVAGVGAGAVAGIAGLSNVLKALLARHSGTVHAALLGLVVGSVPGLWPFQEPVLPELADKHLRKATAMLVAGEERAALRERYAARVAGGLDDARLDALERAWAGRTPAELKELGDALRRFTPSLAQVLSALALAALGFGATRLLGRGESLAGKDA